MIWMIKQKHEHYPLNYCSTYIDNTLNLLPWNGSTPTTSINCNNYFLFVSV